MLGGKRTVRWLIMWRVGEAGLVIVLVGVIIFLSGRIQVVRRQIAERHLALEQSLGDVARMAELEEELAYRRHDINRILAFVPERATLGDVVGALEQAAQQLGLVLLVPDIQEEVKLGEEGEVIIPTGPLREVRLHLVASGAPDKTLRWLHAVEHQPYLLAVVDWSFATELRQERRSARALGPAGGPPGASGEPEVAAGLRVGTVEAAVIVTILVSEGGEDGESES